MGNLKINGQLIVNENIIDDFIIDYYPKTQEEKNIANGNWWKLYKSGRLEQGGRYITSSTWNIVTDISLLNPYSNTNYSVFITPIGETNQSAGTRAKIVSNTSFNLGVWGITAGDKVIGASWMAVGYK